MDPRNSTMTSLSTTLAAHTIMLNDTTGGIHGDVVLRFENANPLALTLVAAGSDWPVAREVLERGLHHRAGDGDVQVFTSPDEVGTVCVRLAGQDPWGGRNGAVVFLEKGPVELFLAVTQEYARAALEGDALGYALDRELLDILDPPLDD